MKIINIILLIVRIIFNTTIQFIFINRKFNTHKKIIYILIATTIFSVGIFGYFTKTNIIYRLFSMISTLFTFYLILPTSIIDYKITKDGKYIMNYYSQLDKRWASIKYGTSNIWMSMSGCVPVTMAMVHSSVNENITPTQTVEWGLTNTNYIKNKGTDIEFLIQYGKAYNFTCGYIYRNDINVILPMLRDGYFIFALISTKLHRLNKILGFAQAHQICIYDIDGDKIKIVDPENISTVNKPISVTKLKRLVENLPENINAPFVYMKYGKN